MFGVETKKSSFVWVACFGLVSTAKLILNHYPAAGKDGRGMKISILQLSRAQFMKGQVSSLAIKAK